MHVQTPHTCARRNGSENVTPGWLCNICDLGFVRMRRDSCGLRDAYGAFIDARASDAAVILGWCFTAAL